MGNIDPRPRNFRCYIFQHFSKWRALFANVLVQLRVALGLRCSKVKQLHPVIWSPRAGGKSPWSDWLCFSKNVLLLRSGAFYIACTSLFLFLKKTCSFLCFLNLSKSNLKAKCSSFSSNLSAEGKKKFLYPTSFHFLIGSNQHPTNSCKSKVELCNSTYSNPICCQ